MTSINEKKRKKSQGVVKIDFLATGLNTAFQCCIITMMCLYVYNILEYVAYVISNCGKLDFEQK